MAKIELNSLIQKGDQGGVRALLLAGVDLGELERQGNSPLARAVESDAASPELLRLLLEFGAKVGKLSKGSVLEAALGKGDPAKLRVLLSAGADLQGVDESGYDALIHAVYGRDISRDPQLLDFLRLLIEQRVDLNRESNHGESGLSVLSHRGRFDAVQVLLDAGANPAPLAWTPLLQAAALGSLEDVDRCLRDGADLEGRDRWDRTAWLIAVKAGDLPKATFLKEKGANTRAKGRCGKPALVHAIESHHPDMVRWLIGIGADVEEADDFGESPLVEATREDDVECVELLLKAGADPNLRRPWTPPQGLVLPRFEFDSEPLMKEPAISRAGSRRMALRLLEAGADPADLSGEGRRVLAGLPPAGEIASWDVLPPQFERGRKPRFGKRNPELMEEPFWIAMIRSGVSGYQANEYFHGPSSQVAGPVWCAMRFGQSVTLLPDGRAVQIAGEHEDSYDPDFCIYNDVFVHEPDGSIRIYGYPEDEFPPTDFHTATLVGTWIYVIGSLGYEGDRRLGTTPVYRLDTQSFRFERLATSGEGPGWIHRHRATPISPSEIRVQGGLIAQMEGDQEVHLKNARSFVLDLERLVWRLEQPASENTRH